MGLTNTEWRRPKDLEPIEALDLPTGWRDIVVGGALKDAKLRRFKDAFGVADTLKVLFVGETIVDEYRYVRALQKSSKEYVIATVETGRAEFAGGIVAASKHAEWDNCDHITSWKTIRKTRMVDADFKRKLFEVYSTDHLELTVDERAYFRRHLDEEVQKADVVIVFDFGHGLMGHEEREIVSQAQFLAVNAQSNAGNYGFNPVTKYFCADLICIDEPELRLATQAPEVSVTRAIEILADRVDCDYILITRGKNGMMGMGEDGVFEYPAFASGGVDTIGAGDAVMAVTAPLLATGLSFENAAYAGNMAGAIKVGIVGHQRHVEREELLSAIERRL